MNRFLVPFAVAVAVASLSACSGQAGPAGAQGPAGAPCTVASNGDGTKTIACPGSASVTVADGAPGDPGAPGAPGTSCTVTGGGTPVRTISCADGTTVTVSDGAPCSATDNGDGTKTLACPGSAPVVVRDGTLCSVVELAGGASILTCGDGTRTLLAPPLSSSLDVWEDLPGLVVTIAGLGGATNADGTFAPGDRLAVTFRVTTSAGRLLSLRELDEAGAWLSGPSTGYQHLLPAARDAAMYTDVATAARLNDDGSFTYAFPDALPTTFGVPLFDTTRFSDGERSGPLTTGTYTVALAASRTYLVAGRPVPDGGSAARDLALGLGATLATRAVVSDANCATCHGQLRAHGGKYRSVALCLTCHTAGAEDAGSTDVGDATPVTIELGVLVHKLHDGLHLPSVQGLLTAADGSRVYGAGTPYVVGARDFSAVAFPLFPNFSIAMPKDSGYSALPSSSKLKEDNVRRGVTGCAACHGDPDGAGPLPAPAQGGDAFAAPSRRACGSCHDDLDFGRPYTANGSTMPANASEATCGLCHGPASLQAAHRHPVSDPNVAPEATITVTALLGGNGPSGGFLAGDPMVLQFTLQDAAGADLPITALDSFTVGLVGPTINRQLVTPGGPISACDVAGRLASASTTNKGTMGKVQAGGALTSETLLVEFTSASAFTVSGTVSGALASGVLPGSPGTNPSGSSLTNVVLSSSVVAQNVTVTFSSSTSYTVVGSVTGPMGSGTLPAPASNTQRFTSSDGTLAFNVVVGATAPAAGNTFNLSLVRGGPANPVLFALVGGRTAFAAGDRFYYDLIAPAASYLLPLPMDLALELLGRADGSAGQAFTAANLPVRYGRQTLLERTATPGVVMTTGAGAGLQGRYLSVTALDPAVAANDYLVVDDGTASEEYVRVSAIDAASGRLTLSVPLRFAHPAGATVREVTMTFRQEGSANAYTLSPATGVVALNGAATAGNAFVMSYRTDATFGWKRRLGDTIAPFYAAPLSESLGLDETWGDWRGKPLVDGTYTVAAWGYRAVEHRSGAAGAFEWQTYRATTRAATLDVLYGATAATLAPYAKIEEAEARCNACHGDLSFHGGGRRGPDACLVCHATPGPAVSYRTLLHGLHAPAFPAAPGGAARCAACHGAADVTVPPSRSHPTQQARPALDWTLACTSCHSSTSAQAHAETMTAPSSGYEACATCHGPGRELSVERAHQAR